MKRPVGTIMFSYAVNVLGGIISHTSPTVPVATAPSGSSVGVDELVGCRWVLHTKACNEKALAGLEGVVLRRRGRWRVYVGVEFFGQSSELEIDPMFLDAIDEGI